MIERPSWDDYFMRLCHVVATRSTCLRRTVGAILVINNRIIATGYNGPPTKISHCDERGDCYRTINNIPSGQRMDLCRASHAEQNAICQAARHGIATENSTLYCTTRPCLGCVKSLINAGYY